MSTFWGHNQHWELATEALDSSLAWQKKRRKAGTALVAQWLRIRLPMQGIQGFEPWSGKIPHAAEQLSPCATTSEPVP